MARVENGRGPDHQPPRSLSATDLPSRPRPAASTSGGRHRTLESSKAGAHRPGRRALRGYESAIPRRLRRGSRRICSRRGARPAARQSQACAFTRPIAAFMRAASGDRPARSSRGDAVHPQGAHRAEKNARAYYRALIAQAGKDRKKVRARSPPNRPSFSSKRERASAATTTARTVHGFCAARLTEARAVARARSSPTPAAFEAENHAPERSAAPPRPARSPSRPRRRAAGGRSRPRPGRADLDRRTALDRRLVRPRQLPRLPSRGSPACG